MRKKIISTWIIVALLSATMTATPVFATENTEEQFAAITDNVSIETEQENTEIPSTDTSDNQMENTEDISDDTETDNAEDISDNQVENEGTANVEDTTDIQAEENEKENIVGSRYDYRNDVYYDRNDYVSGPTREAQYADSSKVGTWELPYEGEYGVEIYAEESGFRFYTKKSVDEFHTYRIPYLYYGEQVTIFRVDESGSTLSTDQITFTPDTESKYGFYDKNLELALKYQKYDYLVLYSKSYPALSYTIEASDKNFYLIPYDDYHVEAVRLGENGPSYKYECNISFKKGGQCDAEYCHTYKIDALNSNQILMSYTPSKPFTRVIFNVGGAYEEIHESYDGSVIRKNLYSDAGRYNIAVYEGDDESSAEEVINETVYSSYSKRDIRFIEFNPGEDGKVYKPESIIAYGRMGNITLTEGTDYTVEDTVDAVTQKPIRIFKGIGLFKGERIFEKDEMSLTDTCAKVTTKYQNYPYTGKGRKPTPIVTYNGNRLVLDKDFTASYKNNKNVGTATLTVTGIGKYTGSISCKFKVKNINVCLSFSFAQTASKLLYKHRETLCRTKKQNCINLRNIHAFIKHIHNKKIIDFFVLQSSIKSSTHLGILAC